MSDVSSLSVEVFRDFSTPEVNLEPVLEDLRILQVITGAIEVVKTTRQLKFLQDNHVIERNPYMKLPKFDADLNVVATTRELGSSVVPYSGIAYTPSNGPNRRLAFVNTRPEDGKHATGHNVGHLLGLGECHCSGCMMYPEHEKTSQAQRLLVKAFATTIFGGVRVNAMDRLINGEPVEDTLCGDCTTDVLRNVDALLQSKVTGRSPGF